MTKIERRDKIITSIVAALGGTKVLGEEVRNRMELHALILRGMPARVISHIRKEFDLSDGVIARIIGVSPGTVSRIRRKGAIKAGARLSSVQSDRIYRLGRIIALAIKEFKNKRKTLVWLKSARHDFGGRSVLDMLETYAGACMVEDLLIRRRDILDHGSTGINLGELREKAEEVAKETDAPTIRSPRTRESRTALAKMITKLFDLWELSTEDQAVLLGLSEKDKASIAHYRKGTPFPDRRELMERAAALLSIHLSLRILFPQNKEIVYSWMTTPNRAFWGLSPVDIVRENGFQGLLAVKQYLDSERKR